MTMGLDSLHVIAGYKNFIPNIHLGRIETV